ncbi:MAG: FAD-dependent oxidoreductase [Acidobacteriota bacterium]
MQLKNQFIMAPVKLGFSENNGEINQKHINFYKRRSAYIGAVTLEPLYLDKGLREIPTQIGIDDDNKIEGLERLAEQIHREGAKVIAHLNHPGRMANPKLPGNYFLSSTDKPCENGGATPKRMNEEDMEKVRKLFVEGALRSEKAGFDIIELQFGHGYLLAQFLSKEVNDRNDEFGGTFENRLRFPLSVFNAVKRSVNIPVIVRVSAEEMTPGGIKIDETIKLLKILEDKGVAAAHISTGTVCSTPPWYFQHMFVPKGKSWNFASVIKKGVNIPLIFVGRVNSIKDINLLKDEFKADYISVGRAMVADPDFIGKYEQKVFGNIRPCLACSEGCLGGVRSGRGLGCVVNPVVGREYEPILKAEKKKRFAIVGAGLAGLETALTLKARGHEVTLYEKGEFGGQFNLAWLPPNKESLKEIIDYYSDELEQDGISIIHKDVEAPELINGKFDGVILATGAVPVVPPIKGLSEYFWAEFMHEENIPENKKIVVIGGGLIGIEITSRLIDKNNEVFVVEMLEEAARGMEMIEKTMTLKKLKLKNVNIYTDTKADEIDGNKIYLKGRHDIIIEDIDHFVVATGMKSYVPLFDQLNNKTPVHLVGDAKMVGKAQDAIHDGYFTAMEL